jgi:hypothetical protein
LFEQNIATPLGVAHARDLFLRTDGFNELVWIQEDWEFWRTLARLGTDFLFVRMRSGVYHVRAGSQSRCPVITKSQYAAYELNLRRGRTLYGTSYRSIRRRANQRVLFAGTDSYLDLVSLTPRAAVRILETLAGSGFTCQVISTALCAPGADDLEHQLARGGRAVHTLGWTCGTHVVRVSFTSSAGVGVTVVRPDAKSSCGNAQAVGACFLASYQRLLEVYQPDVLMTHGCDPHIGPIVSLAKRRDIPIVALLLGERYADPWQFHKIDYCLVTKNGMRAHYWQNLGLGCIALPADAASCAELFRNIRPQPGPPFVPLDTRSTTLINSAIACA